MRLLAATIGAALLMLAPEPSHAEAEPSVCRMLFNFSGSNAVSAWETTNDNVMGGRSSGGASVSDEVLAFSGVINTNGGGFSSIAANLPQGALSDVSALRIRYKGDGRTYLMSLETGERRRLVYRIQYWNEFKAMSDEGWHEATLPLAGFRPHFFGEPIEGPVLDPARVDKLGFFINDKKDGPFDLKIDWIKAC